MKNNKIAHIKLLMLLPCFLLAGCGESTYNTSIATPDYSSMYNDLTSYNQTSLSELPDYSSDYIPTPSQPGREDDVTYVKVEKDEKAHVLVLQAYSKKTNAIQVVGRIYTYEGETFDDVEPYFPTIPEYIDNGRTWEQTFEKYDADGKEYAVWDAEQLTITLTAVRSVKR